MASGEADVLPDVTALFERPRLVRWLADGSTFVLTRFAVLRLLGLVYFVAFASAWIQAPALIGEHGLLPMRGHVAFPSLFLLASSDAMLRAVAGLGALLALGVLAGVTNAGVLLVLWMLQLSLANAGRIFWGYGWEIQLCETGLIAAFACPLRTFGPFASAPPTTPIWLFRWLIARVMLGAGLIKLRGDPCWRDLTCLLFHYETQPNPSPVSWLFHQAPPLVHTIGVLFNHVVELAAPVLLLGPRSARRVVGVLFVVFQTTLIVSGNLAFLNWLTIVPALACFDDELLARLAPRALVRAAQRALATPPTRLHVRTAHAFALIVGILSVGPALNLVSDRQRMNASFDPLHIVNTYGAFGTISRVRHEVVLEGTRDEKLGDAAHWEEYELPCKPGNIARRPCIVTPWHYRLDWQMWFAAQSSYEEEPWIIPLAAALLRNDPAIAPLIAKNPFAGGAPPHWVRAELYRYEFTKRGEGAAWWRRTPVGEYLPPLSLDDPMLPELVEAARAQP